jgi:hypothetical protein
MCSNDVVRNWEDIFIGTVFQLMLGSLGRHFNTSSDILEVLRLKISLHRMLPGMVVGAIKNGNQGNKSIRHSSREKWLVRAVI